MNYKRLRRWLLRILAAVLLISIAPVLVLRWVAPPTSSVILQRGFSEGQPQDYQWTPITRISPYAALAVVAAEDQRPLARCQHPDTTGRAQPVPVAGAQLCAQGAGGVVYPVAGDPLVEATHSRGLFEYCRDWKTDLRCTGCCTAIFSAPGQCTQQGTGRTDCGRAAQPREIKA